ncbi:transposase [Thermomonospora umbrina]|uniref:Integrase catalytic domain-containing protein n=1 Tax=Thermomonospora umbrina TaxID=111806 RepID=A0A3D9T3F0_9ACTN|nr:transposase [Thermomonospora umbrina]REE98331.1 hypothetical protein DFJ69_3818 [Thermomonospora umbrina]
MNGLIELAPDAVLVVDGVEWTVEAVEPHLGRVQLRLVDEQMAVKFRDLMARPGSWSRPRVVRSSSGQDLGWDDLTDRQIEIVHLRYAHLMETESGYRRGTAMLSLPGEPRAAFDPVRTTVTQRRFAKVAELAALDLDEARMLGLARVSYRTLERWASRCQLIGPLGCASGAWTRRSNGRWSISEPIREALYAVREEALHRSRLSMRDKERLIHQYVRERFGPDVVVPSAETLRLVWREWFGPGGSRQRYERSAGRRTVSTERVVVHRPGQVVALDTTELPVMVREDVFGEPVSVMLTLALDVYTHSLVAFRLTLVSDTSVDVAMLLRDVMMPLPMREGWGEDMQWPYPGIPEAVVAEFAGHRVAALPFFTPETVTTDHGAVYKNHRLVDVQRVIGANVLPCRVLRPTDKQAVERAFGSIRSLLLDLLPGYKGVDVSDRGADVEGDAVITIDRMEQLLAKWIVKVWQNRVLGESAPAWDPGGRHSPNTLFAASLVQGGFAMAIPSPDLFYELLPSRNVSKIDPRRGAKVSRLWYHGPVLDDLVGTVPARGGARKGRWRVHWDPRDRRFTYFQDPDSGEWHQLRWTGLPEKGEIPSFGDARVKELMHLVRERGLTPKTDAELLPVLLELLGGLVPVDSWPTQLTKTQKTGHARENRQGKAATTDRPQPAAANEPVPMRSRARQSVDAVDAERRRRREQAMDGRQIVPPPRLGDAIRRRGMFSILPGDLDDTDDLGSSPDDAAQGHEEGSSA